MMSLTIHALRVCDLQITCQCIKEYLFCFAWGSVVCGFVFSFLRRVFVVFGWVCFVAVAGFLCM